MTRLATLAKHVWFRRNQTCMFEEFKSADDWKKFTGDAMSKELKDAGLNQAEAESMTDIWWEGFFVRIH